MEKRLDECSGHDDPESKAYIKNHVADFKRTYGGYITLFLCLNRSREVEAVVVKPYCRFESCDKALSDPFLEKIVKEIDPAKGYEELKAQQLRANEILNMKGHEQVTGFIVDYVMEGIAISAPVIESAKKDWKEDTTKTQKCIDLIKGQIALAQKKLEKAAEEKKKSGNANPREPLHLAQMRTKLREFTEQKRLEVGKLLIEVFTTTIMKCPANYAIFFAAKYQEEDNDPKRLPSSNHIFGLGECIGPAKKVSLSEALDEDLKESHLSEEDKLKYKTKFIELFLRLLNRKAGTCLSCGLEMNAESGPSKNPIYKCTQCSIQYCVPCFGNLAVKRCDMCGNLLPFSARR